jgi:hypothetical protein
MSKQNKTVTGQRALLTSTCSDYLKVWNDDGSHAKKDVTIFRPLPPSGYYILGDYAQGSYSNHALGGALVVTEEIPTDADPKDISLIRSPDGVTLVWHYESTSTKKSWYIYLPKAPAGYVSIGCIASTTEVVDSEVLKKYACLHQSVVVPTKVGPLIWSDRSAHTSGDVSLYSIVDVSNVFVAQTNYLEYSGTAYGPKVVH